MINVKLDIKELSEFEKDILNFAQEHMPKNTKTFMKREASKLATRTKRVAKKTIKSKTGNYIKGIKSSKAYEYDYGKTISAKAYAGRPAYHGHLLEYGHDMVIKNRKTKVKKTVGFVEGYNVFSKAGAEYQAIFNSNAEKFAEKIINEI